MSKEGSGSRTWGVKTYTFLASKKENDEKTDLEISPLRGAGSIPDRPDQLKQPIIWIKIPVGRDGKAMKNRDTHNSLLHDRVSCNISSNMIFTCSIYINASPSILPPPLTYQAPTIPATGISMPVVYVAASDIRYT